MIAVENCACVLRILYDWFATGNAGKIHPQIAVMCHCLSPMRYTFGEKTLCRCFTLTYITSGYGSFLPKRWVEMGISSPSPLGICGFQISDVLNGYVYLTPFPCDLWGFIYFIYIMVFSPVGIQSDSQHYLLV